MTARRTIGSHDIDRTGGEPHAVQETLAQLECANLFVIPLDHERRWYRYHHLFRDLLRQRLMNTLPSDRIAQIHLRASAWLEANGGMAQAFQHALAAGDVGRAARLAESAWQAMDETFQTGAWLGWVKQLPQPAARQNDRGGTKAISDPAGTHRLRARL